MLQRITPVAFHRAMRSGRTRPAFLVCETTSGEEVEVVAKFSATCDQRVTNLAREAIAACLAGDLGLPIMQPYLLSISPAWVASVPDAGWRAIIEGSAAVAFGSTFAGPQFSLWNAGTTLSPAMVNAALATLVFDAIIQNPDRRAENPNCLVRGTTFRIFDHEMAFAHRLIIGWRPPWEAGSLQLFETPGFHIFRHHLKRKVLDFAPVKDSWVRLTDSRIDAYAAALPGEWAAATADVASAITLIKAARDQIDLCLAEIQRVLT
jgi:hypothetical protein